MNAFKRHHASGNEPFIQSKNPSFYKRAFLGHGDKDGRTKAESEIQVSQTTFFFSCVKKKHGGFEE